ncbi:hypothetical protein [Paenibacillus kribbensis]|uniref:hypothetical protein n=1 Tax=Paenibacillus kribbensis TaxID=172713 RepID=UPI0008382021|nr:hypothetical protein [Paenibacillus kribbensis]
MSYGWVGRRCANDLILRSLLQRDALIEITHLKVGISLQRRTLALLQIQILRFATDRRKVKQLLNNWLWLSEPSQELN